MLLLEIPETEFFNEEKNEFITVPKQTLRLEHSLISISKWESKYCKPFITDEPKTVEETLYYIQCMTINPHVDPNVYLCITDDMVGKVNEYIAAPMSATTFHNLEGNRRPRKKETLTSELVYYYMVAGGIPVEFERWHFNRLMNLITIVGIKNDPNPKKASKRSILKSNSQINAARRKAMHSKG